MVSALPSSFTKFEQKAVLNIDTAEVTSLVRTVRSAIEMYLNQVENALKTF